MDTAFVEGARALTVGALVASSEGTSIANAANSKPATPTQLIASTAEDACGIITQIGAQTAATSALVDIMAGGAGAEYVLIPDLLASVATGAESQASYFFPIFIPKGTRLSARAAMSTAGTIRVACQLLSAAGGFGMSPFSRVTAYGAVVGSSRGTDIDPGASANTKPALPATQLVASIANPIRLLTVAVGQAGDFARTPAGAALLDIYAGAGSGEYALIENIYILFGTSKDSWGPQVPIPNVPIRVPPGTRLSARGQCSIATAGDRLWDVIVYGVD